MTETNSKQMSHNLEKEKESESLQKNLQDKEEPLLDANVNKSKKKSNNNTSHAIKTFCRIRPVESKNEIFKVKENTEGRVLLVNWDPALLKKLNTVPIFTFSKTFDEFTTQTEVFENTCKTLVEDLVVKKKSGLIFTYGMTNAGKTYTVIGTASDQGILPRSLQYLYQQFETENLKGEASVYCNFVEIYNEEVFDLLAYNPKNKFFKKKMMVKENMRKFFLPEVTYHKIGNLGDFNLALQKGISKKVHAATNLNQNSSRSHTIFKIILKSNNPDEEETSLSIVDLAGSERANRTEAQGKELQEACSINQSLSILGKCMEALRCNSIFTNKKIVPFRESKLTKLFQEYFQGDQNVIMITNINPRREDFEETIRALNYSCIAKEIKPIKSRIVINPIKKQVKLVNSDVAEVCSIDNESVNNTLTNIRDSMNIVPENFNCPESITKISSNVEIDSMKLELERLKEEMFFLKNKDSHNISEDGRNSLQKFSNFNHHYSAFPNPTLEMQLAMMGQMNQMMKMMKMMTESPMSMILPSANPFLPSGKCMMSNNPNSNESKLDVDMTPLNTNSFNLVFINSKFNDFHMGQNKKRTGNGNRNKKKNAESLEITDIITLHPLEEAAADKEIVEVPNENYDVNIDEKNKEEKPASQKEEKEKKKKKKKKNREADEQCDKQKEKKKKIKPKVLIPEFETSAYENESLLTQVDFILEDTDYKVVQEEPNEHLVLDTPDKMHVDLEYI